MPDDTNVNVNEEQPGEAPDPQGAASGGDNGEPKGKTFTEAEVNAMMAARLAKHEKSLKSTWEREQAEIRRKSEQSAEERAAEAERKAVAAQENVERVLKQAEQRVALAGKVRDLDYAMFKIGQDEERFLKDGKVDVEGFLKAHPDQTLSRSGPAPATPAGKGPTEKASMNDLIRDQINRAR